MDSRVAARSVFRTAQTIRLMLYVHKVYIHVCMDYIQTTYKCATSLYVCDCLRKAPT